MKFKHLLPFLMILGFLIWQVEAAGEVAIQTEDGLLYGTLMEVPEGTRAPVALILAGSGATDRNGNNLRADMRNDALKWLAYDLREEGIASLRYDKRTAGKSEREFKGDPLEFDDFVKDAESAIRFLKEAGYDRIYVIGHSQGALVAMLAAGSEPVSGVVSLVGGGRPIDRILEEQLKNLSRPLGEEAAEILERLRLEKPVGDMSPDAARFFSTDNQSFLKSWMVYNPAEEARRLKVPLLCIGGGTDLQVPQWDLDLLAESSPLAEKRLFKDMNHVLKEAPRDRNENLKRYTDPSYELAGGLIETLSHFIR